jgi:ubiquinone/menaquinone biosynthesis C-methylase UbiE
MNFYTRIEKIIHKIIKNSQIKNKIYETLTSDIYNKNKTFDKKMIFLSQLIQSNISCPHPGHHNKTFISNKLSNYIKNRFSNNCALKNAQSATPSTLKTADFHQCREATPEAFSMCKGATSSCSVSELSIVDIGGGNGQMLREIGENLKIPKSNLFSIESMVPWTHPYPFSNSEYIQYVFWDNDTIPNIQPLSIDVVIIAVTLHHMSDSVIQKTFENLKRIMKPMSILIIKEHDCKTKEDKLIIDWEHHLYHLIESPLQDEENIEKYKDKFINNYKSKQQWTNIIESHGYEPIIELNRLFERNIDSKNPTNLYWRIYILSS